LTVACEALLVGASLCCA